MDKLVEKRREKFFDPEGWCRDQWIEAWASKFMEGDWVLDAGAGASKYRPFFVHCRYETQDFCQYDGPLVKYVESIDYVCDIVRIPLPDSSLDGILCTEVFEHLTNPVAALEEFRRLLKPGGLLLLTVPVVSRLHMEPYHYYTGLTKYWYKHWLPEFGFTIDSMVPQGGRGRTGVVFLRIAYGDWRAWERELQGVKRFISLILRICLAKPFVHYIIPWLATRIGSKPNADRETVGLMVAARWRQERGG